MTWYQVTTDGDLWCGTSDPEEAEEHFGYALNERPGARVVLSRLYEPPPKPDSAHWIDEKVVYATGKNGLTRPSD